MCATWAPIEVTVRPPTSAASDSEHEYPVIQRPGQSEADLRNTLSYLFSDLISSMCGPSKGNDTTDRVPAPVGPCRESHQSRMEKSPRLKVHLRPDSQKYGSNASRSSLGHGSHAAAERAQEVAGMARADLAEMRRRSASLIPRTPSPPRLSVSLSPDSRNYGSNASSSSSEHGSHAAAERALEVAGMARTDLSEMRRRSANMMHPE